MYSRFISIGSDPSGKKSTRRKTNFLPNKKISVYFSCCCFSSTEFADLQLFIGKWTGSLKMWFYPKRHKICVAAIQFMQRAIVELITEKKNHNFHFFSGFNLAQSVRRGLLIIFWQVFSSHVPYSPCTCTYEHGNHNGSQWTDKARWNINQFGQEIETLYLHIFCFGFGLSFHVWCEVRTYSAYRHVMEFHHNFCSPLFHRLLLCQLFACGSGTHKNAHLLACQLYVCKIIPRCWRRRCDLTFLVFICSQASVWWAEYVIDCFCKSFQIWSNFWFLTNFGNATDETANGMMWCWLWCKLQIHIFDVQLNARCG